MEMWEYVVKIKISTNKYILLDYRVGEESGRDGGGDWGLISMFICWNQDQNFSFICFLILMNYRVVIN